MENYYIAIVNYVNQPGNQFVAMSNKEIDYEMIEDFESRFDREHEIFTRVYVVPLKDSGFIFKINPGIGH